MKKKEIIKDSKTFEYVIKNGQKLKNQYYNIFYLINSKNVNQFGLAVGKKIGNAVERNKNKRQIRCIIDQNKSLFKKPYYYIIMVKRDINNLNFNEKEKALISLIEKEKK